MSEDFAASVRYDALEFCWGEGLDLGCGDARPWDYMVGIDNRAGTSGRGPNLVMDATNLTRFADGSQDYIFSSYLLHELIEQGKPLPDVLTGWWRLLRPDGYLMLFLPITETCTPKIVLDAMEGAKPWQLVDARVNGQQFIQVYRKREAPHLVATLPDPEKVCAVMKLGAHGDALWASSVLAHLKEQGYYVVLYTQETGEEVLRHDPNIDKMIRFESRVPMGELGGLFQWIEKRYKHHRILVECVEGTLLPAPSKIQYHFPPEIRARIMDENYLEFHHLVGRVPLEPRQKFYPSNEEAEWANAERMKFSDKRLVVLVPNGSSVTKMWPYAGEFVRRLVAERDDIQVVVLGDLRGYATVEHPRVWNIGLSWPVRKAMTFALLGDIVIGQETGLLNAVAFEKEVMKVVLLSHSSVKNLTRDWPNTVAFSRPPAECGPTSCHRLHYTFEYCKVDEPTRAAKCQAAILVQDVLKVVHGHFDGDQREEEFERVPLRAVAGSR